MIIFYLFFTSQTLSHNLSSSLQYVVFGMDDGDECRMGWRVSQSHQHIKSPSGVCFKTLMCKKIIHFIERYFFVFHFIHIQREFQAIC
jgi:hypothetical protein